MHAQYLQSNDCLLKIQGQILKKTVITLQIMRLKLKTLNQTCTSSKTIRQLPDSDPVFLVILLLFLKEKTVMEYGEK
jgi:hypothetical protein